MVKDSRELREKCKANIWPESLLAKYHPRDDYDGSVEKAFTQLMYLSPALHDLIQGFFDRKERSIDDGLLSFTQYEFDLIPREIMMTANALKKTRRGYDKPVDILQMTWLVKQSNDGLWTGIKKAEAEKAVLKAPRPEWLSIKDYEGEFDSPSIWATAMAMSTHRVFVEFDIDQDMVFDTAYLLSMMPAMYGRCHIDSCLHGLYLAGMLSKDYKTQII